MSDVKGMSQADQEKLKILGENIIEGDTSTASQLALEQERSAEKNALYNYLSAVLQLESGQIESAQAKFKQAVDLDCFRVRTTASFNNEAEKLAKNFEAVIADVEKVFSENSDHGIIGSELVYDHVHLTERGHYLAARCIFGALKQLKLHGQDSLPENFPLEAELLTLLGYTGTDAIANLEHIISSMSRPPFTLQYANQQRLAGFSEILDQLQKQSSRVGDLAAAEKAQGYQPYNYRTSLRLAMLQNDAPTAATKMFEHSLRLNPFNIDTLNNLASLKIQQNQLSEAETLLQRSLELAPGFAQAYFNLGLIAAARKDSALAASHYKTAVTADPSMFLALRNLGNLHFRNREFALAKTTYEMAAAAAPDDMPSQLGIGNCLMEMQQTSMAIEMYQRAAEAFKDSPLPRYSLGKALEKSGKPAEAAKAYEEAARLGHLPSLQQLINLQLSEKIALDPDHFAKLCLLGCEMTDFKDPWFNQTLAISHAQRGELDEALGVLHRAANLAREQGQNQLLIEIEANITAINAAKQ